MFFQCEVGRGKYVKMLNKSVVRNCDGYIFNLSAHVIVCKCSDSV